MCPKTPEQLPSHCSLKEDDHWNPTQEKNPTSADKGTLRTPWRKIMYTGSASFGQMKQTRALWPKRCCLCLENKGGGEQPREHRPHGETWWWEYYSAGMLQCELEPTWTHLDSAAIALWNRFFWDLETKAWLLISLWIFLQCRWLFECPSMAAEYVVSVRTWAILDFYDR